MVEMTEGRPGNRLKSFWTLKCPTQGKLLKSKGENECLISRSTKA